MVQKIRAESTTDSSAANPRWIKDFAYACFFLFDFRVCLKLKQITYFFLCCSPEKFSVFFFVLAAPVAHLHLLTFNIFLITAHKYFNLSDKINVRQHLRCLSVLFKSRLFKFSKQKKKQVPLVFYFSILKKKVYKSYLGTLKSKWEEENTLKNDKKKPWKTVEIRGKPWGVKKTVEIRGKPWRVKKTVESKFSTFSKIFHCFHNFFTTCFSKWNLRQVKNVKFSFFLSRFHWEYNTKHWKRVENIYFEW